ncbi:MAG: class I tRNA ligase family protein, partial [Terriglobales bacterium]
GRARSKSLGNVVDPVDIADRLGGEIVRFWVASVDFREDVRGSEELMQRVADNYRKVRTTFRYILGNLHEFDPQRDAVAFADMEALDRYLLQRAAEVAARVRSFYDQFEFHKAYHLMHDFCTVHLSAFYFDVLKDRLYTFAPRSPARRSAQTALWRIGEALVRLLAPLMSFTADEVWQYLPRVAARPASVHLALFPAPHEVTGASEAAAGPPSSDWETLLSVRSEVLKALEAARNGKQIGGSLEAHVVIAAPDPAYSVLSRHQGGLRELFIVSGVTLERAEPGNGAGGLIVEVRRAAGGKCERCWNYSTRVGENPTYPAACERCLPVLEEIAASRQS